MTSEKQPKKSYLRNAEYYDFQDVLDDLYSKSENDYIFKKLFDIIVEPQNIMLAYRNIKKNNGSKTAGIDKKTIETYVNKLNLNEKQLAKVNALREILCLEMI